MKCHTISLLGAVMLTSLAAPVAFAATTASSSAFGESVNLKVLPILGSPLIVTSGPLPSVAGSAPGSYGLTQQLASAHVGLGLLSVGTGILTVDASSNVPNSLPTSADATVDNLGVLAGLLSLNATVVRSQASIGGTCGAITTSGSSLIAGATLNGAAVVANAAPNTVLLDAGGIKVVLNEQITGGNGTSDSSVTVNAIHISFQAAPLGLNALSGDIIISQSTASLHCTPQTSSADLMITKTAVQNPVTVGSRFSYAIVVTNLGPNAATNVVVTDPLPSSVTFNAVGTIQGSCTGTSTVTCNLGTINPGATVRIELGVVANQGPMVINTATVKADQPDPNPSNNVSSATVTVN